MRSWSPARDHLSRRAGTGPRFLQIALSRGRNRPNRSREFSYRGVSFALHSAHRAEHLTPNTAASDELLKELDSSKITKLHWQIMFISGMGFFTDAYDLFIIGVVMAILKNEWHPTATETGLVTSTALIASAIGAILFGRIADMLGRKRIYGYECLVLAAGAVASAFSPNIIWLIVFRFILGIGIGGDYPVSATIISEYAGISSRGMLITLVFTMQAAGLILGPLLASAFLASGMPHDTAWRVLLAVGAIPAVAVFQLRRNIHETPRYLLAAGRKEEFERSAGTILGKETSRRKRNAKRRKQARAEFPSAKALRPSSATSECWPILPARVSHGS